MTPLRHSGTKAPRGLLQNLLCIFLLFASSIFYFSQFFSEKSASLNSPQMNYMVPKSANANSESLNSPNSLTPTKNKTILFWTTFYGTRDFWELLFRDTASGGCPVSHCLLTGDRRLLHQADAVVFHLLDIQLKDLPRWRRSSQIWVLFCLESPAYPRVSQLNLARFNGLFNWTMTYRWDSDVPVPYGLVLPRDPLAGTVQHHGLPEVVRRLLPLQPALDQSQRPRPKDRLVAWMVSNCKTPGRREQYVDELRKHIPVDVYGGCGKLKCGRSESVQQQNTHTNTQCEQIIGDYKFYLAFENTICPDYVSEKFFRTLTLGTVPVVFGGAQYSALAPDGSYIDALKYTPHELARLLLTLQRNDTAYQQFFRWQDSYFVLNAHPLRPLTCGLCRSLHELPPGTLVGTKDDLDRWYDAKRCSHWQQHL